MTRNRQATPRVFVIAGNESSGKDEIIRAITDLGNLHAQAISKFTSRSQKEGDGPEMILNCHFLNKRSHGAIVHYCLDGKIKKEHCDVVYSRNGNDYGFSSKSIWNGLKGGLHQVVVVSETEAINKLRAIFGGLMVLIYVHSHSTREVYPELAMFVDNFEKFDHVLIYEDKKEDLFDQIFRLFRAYEQGFLG